MEKSIENLNCLQFPPPPQPPSPPQSRQQPTTTNNYTNLLPITTKNPPAPSGWNKRALCDHLDPVDRHAVRGPRGAADDGLCARSGHPERAGVERDLVATAVGRGGGDEDRGWFADEPPATVSQFIVDDDDGDGVGRRRRGEGRRGGCR